MADAFSGNQPGLTAPANKAFAVTPHDTNELANIPRGLFIGVGGDVVVIANGDSAAVTYKNLTSGSILPVRAKVVKSTGTTATDIVAIY